MERNAVDEQGMCGIAKAASYPVKKHDNPQNLPEICGWYVCNRCSHWTAGTCSQAVQHPLLSAVEMSCLQMLINSLHAGACNLYNFAVSDMQGSSS